MGNTPDGQLESKSVRSLLLNTLGVARFAVRKVEQFDHSQSKHGCLSRPGKGFFYDFGPNRNEKYWSFTVITSALFLTEKLANFNPTV